MPNRIHALMQESVRLRALARLSDDDFAVKLRALAGEVEALAKELQQSLDRDEPRRSEWQATLTQGADTPGSP